MIVKSISNNFIGSLGTNKKFTGAFEACNKYLSIVPILRAENENYTIQIQQSNNKTFDYHEAKTVSNDQHVHVTMKYFRVILTNTDVASRTFVLDTNLSLNKTDDAILSKLDNLSSLELDTLSIMNVKSTSNNLNDTLSGFMDFTGPFEACSDYTTIKVNLYTGHNDYTLHLQQTNDVDAGSFNQITIEDKKAYLIEMNFFRLVLMNESAGDLTVSMQTNLLKAYIPQTQAISGNVSITNFPEQPLDLHKERAKGNCFDIVGGSDSLTGAQQSLYAI